MVSVWRRVSASYVAWWIRWVQVEEVLVSLEISHTVENTQGLGSEK
jgi:hypothetical protein